MAPHPDDSPERVRLEIGLQLPFHGHRACTVDDFFTDGHDPAADRLAQLEARVAELEQAGRGRGRGF